MSQRHPDASLAEELAADEAYEKALRNECDRCFKQLPETPFGYRGGVYCDPCAIAMTAHIARGAIPHGGTEADPDSLEICGVAS